jgi:hypothetical protein
MVLGYIPLALLQSHDGRRRHGVNSHRLWSALGKFFAAEPTYLLSRQSVHRYLSTTIDFSPTTTRLCKAWTLSLAYSESNAWRNCKQYVGAAEWPRRNAKFERLGDTDL